VGDGHTKNLRPRRVIERNTEKRGRPQTARAPRGGDRPAHREYDTLLGGGRSSRFNGTTLHGEECNNAKKNATLTL